MSATKQTETRVVSNESIPGRFARVVARFPERIAVSSAGVNWSYVELDQRSNAVANRLMEDSSSDPEPACVGGRPVALLMSHEAPLIAAIIGILKAGSIYLVLDPLEPVARLQAVLEAAGARRLLADGANLTLARSLVGEGMQVIEMIDESPATSVSRTLLEVSPEAGAWLMYTSGSTGTPKGVWQNHRGVVHHADVYAELIQLTLEDRLSLLTPCHLAASTTALFAALLHGATICPFHLRSQGIESLAMWLPQQRITVYHSVPTVFRRLVEAVENDPAILEPWDLPSGFGVRQPSGAFATSTGAPGRGSPGRARDAAVVSSDDTTAALCQDAGVPTFQSVRLVRLGGEAMLPADVAAFQRWFAPGCRLMHAFSSTESGLACAHFIDHDFTNVGSRIPVGWPVRGVEIVLLDELGRPVPAGVEGRIAIHSDHLAQGYWQQPDALIDAFSAGSDRLPGRRYVSGDLGRFRADGCLEHLGRCDHHVKIRGRRVDLLEVEAALKELDMVADAVAAAHADTRGESRLVGYIVPRQGADVTAQACRRALQISVPEHLVPTDFVVLPVLPTTAGGKVDRRKLPPPCSEIIAGHATAPLRYHWETRLAEIWKQALGIGTIGRDDDFFELGGDSLRAIGVMIRIEETFGVVLPASALAEHSTVGRLAALIADQSATLSESPLVELRAAPAGRPLFFIHNGKGTVVTYSQLARRLPGRPIYGLQSRGLRGECWPVMSIPDMVRHYLPEVIRKDSTGPYLLAGSCMGAMVAFEMAQQLVKTGRKVGLLVLIDSSTPPYSGRRSHFNERYIDPIRDSFRMLRWAAIRGIGKGRGVREIQAYRHFIGSMNTRAWRNYRPRMFPGKLTLVNTALFRNGEDRRPLLAGYAPATQTIVIPGNRAGLFKPPSVDELARQFQRLLAEVEGDTGAGE